MIQSESRTWPAFVAREKSVTRRNWKDRTAAWYKAGRVFDAYDNAPFRGGVLIGRARVTRDAYRENLLDCPDEDYIAEGFSYLSLYPELIPKQARAETWCAGQCSRDAFNRWRFSAAIVWVVRFEIVAIEDSAVEKLERMLANAA